MPTRYSRTKCAPPPHRLRPGARRSCSPRRSWRLYPTQWNLRRCILSAVLSAPPQGFSLHSSIDSSGLQLYPAAICSRHNSQLARRPREQESGYVSSADGRDGDFDFDDDDGSEDDTMTKSWQSCTTVIILSRASRLRAISGMRTSMTSSRRSQREIT
jgi:hypothetical protein